MLSWNKSENISLEILQKNRFLIWKCSKNIKKQLDWPTDRGELVVEEWLTTILNVNNNIVELYLQEKYDKYPPRRMTFARDIFFEQTRLSQDDGNIAPGKYFIWTFVRQETESGQVSINTIEFPRPKIENDLYKMEIEEKINAIFS